MSPAEFAVRMSAMDERFTQALARDDLREMRAVLAEKVGLLKVYFAASGHRAHNEKEDTRAAASFESRSFG